MEPLARRPYLETNILHYRPLSIHLYTGIQRAGIALRNTTDQESWQGRVVNCLAKGVGLTGQVLSTVVGMVEACCSLPLGLLGLLLIKNETVKSEIIEKYSIKLLAHAINALTLVVANITSIYHGIFLGPHRVVLALADQAIYLGSATVVQFFFNENRALLPLAEGFGDAFTDIANSLNLMAHLNTPTVQAILERLPQEERDFVTSVIATPRELLDLNNIRRLADLIRPALPEFGVVQGPNPGEFILHNGTEKDNAYRTKLQDYVQRTIVELYKNENLVKHLGDEEKTVKAGREALVGLDANTFIPVANLIQFTELNAQGNYCPEAFESADMIEFNKTDQHQGRHEKIEGAKVLLENLEAEDRDILIERLITTNEIDISRLQEIKKAGIPSKEERLVLINNLYKEICALSSSLHQGKLMCKLTINMQGENSSEHLLRTAWQEAVAELVKK